MGLGFGSDIEKKMEKVSEYGCDRCGVVGQLQEYGVGRKGRDRFFCMACCRVTTGIAQFDLSSRSRCLKAELRTEPVVPGKPSPRKRRRPSSTVEALSWKRRDNAQETGGDAGPPKAKKRENGEEPPVAAAQRTEETSGPAAVDAPQGAEVTADPASDAPGGPQGAEGTAGAATADAQGKRNAGGPQEAEMPADPAVPKPASDAPGKERTGGPQGAEATAAAKMPGDAQRKGNAGGPQGAEATASPAGAKPALDAKGKERAGGDRRSSDSEGARRDEAATAPSRSWNLSHSRHSR